MGARDDGVEAALVVVSCGYAARVPAWRYRDGVTPPRAAAPLSPWDSMPYHSGMSTQITVRLPDQAVAFLDAQVAAGAATSRAALVARAIERERRAVLAERDAAIYAATGDDADLAAFTAAAAAVTPDLD